MLFLTSILFNYCHLWRVWKVISIKTDTQNSFQHAKILMISSDFGMKFNTLKKIFKKIEQLSSPERSRTAIFGSRAQKDCHYPTGLCN